MGWATDNGEDQEGDQNHSLMFRSGGEDEQIGFFGSGCFARLRGGHFLLVSVSASISFFPFSFLRKQVLMGVCSALSSGFLLCESILGCCVGFFCDANRNKASLVPTLIPHFLGFPGFRSDRGSKYVLVATAQRQLLDLSQYFIYLITVRRHLLIFAITP